MLATRLPFIKLLMKCNYFSGMIDNSMVLKYLNDQVETTKVLSRVQYLLVPVAFLEAKGLFFISFYNKE